MTEPLVSLREAAEMLGGLTQDAARKALQRAGITVQHGYPREAVERLARPDGRPGRGRRTDLQRVSPTS